MEGVKKDGQEIYVIKVNIVIDSIPFTADRCSFTTNVFYHAYVIVYVFI